jgi:DNA-binding MarR family transcriptional regulator
VNKSHEDSPLSEEHVKQNFSARALDGTAFYPAISLDELAADLYQVLLGVFLVLGRRNSDVAPLGELTLPQLSILMTLREHGPLRMTALATHEHVRTPTMTVAIHRLEKLELVARYPDPTDGRGALVRITPHGQALCCESLAPRYAQLTSMLSSLSSEDRTRLRQMMPPLERLLDEAGALVR